MNRRMMLFIAIGVIVICIVLVSVALIQSLQPAIATNKQADASVNKGGQVSINIINSSQNNSLDDIENGGALNDSR